jgi:hypothetical protein
VSISLFGNASILLIRLVAERKTVFFLPLPSPPSWFFFANGLLVFSSALNVPSKDYVAQKPLLLSSTSGTGFKFSKIVGSAGNLKIKVAKNDQQ